MAYIVKVIFLLLTIIFITGCESPEPLPVISFAPETPEDIRMAKEIWRKVEERNNAVENTQEWIKESYDVMKVRPLNTLPTYKYVDHKKFLDNGSVYIINHPGFYTFFQHPKITRKLMTNNIMDIFLEKGRTSENSSEAGSKSRLDQKVINIMREFERIERNFLEFKSTEQRLIILILPGNYKKYSSYTYKNEADEYLRFINDVTNMSESVFYLESKKSNRGQLSDDDFNTLMEFLQVTGATSVLLGGEYIGRCQEDFYKQLSDTLGDNIVIEVVPELSPVSPDDMNSKMRDLLDSNNKLDIQAATYNILNNTYNKLDTKPKLRNLNSRLFYEKPNGQ